MAHRDRWSGRHRRRGARRAYRHRGARRAYRHRIAAHAAPISIAAHAAPISIAAHAAPISIAAHAAPISIAAHAAPISIAAHAATRPHHVPTHRPSRPNAAINRVPENTTGGKPGSANSADPAPNVPPLQTPSQPVPGRRP